MGWFEPVAQEVILDSRAEPSRNDVAHLLARDAWAPWINGESAPTGTRQPTTILDPATNEPVALVELAGPDDVDRAVAAAQQAFYGRWMAYPAAERMHLLWAWADALAAHERELCEHTPRTGRLDDEAIWRHHGRRTGPLRVHQPASARRRRGYHPWNGPLASFVFKAAPALAAGCTIVIKPSELTPLTCLHVVALAEQAGIPPGVINVVPGLGDVAGAHLARHPRVARISFTGSTTTGRKISIQPVTSSGSTWSSAGSRRTWCSPTRTSTGPSQVWLRRFCVAGSRVLVEHAIYEEVVGRLVEYARRLVVGPGFDPASEMGPLISRQQVEQVHSYVEGARMDGATVLLGEEGYDDEVRRRGNFYQPTIVVDVDPRMRIACEEVFGPVVTVMPFQSLDEAIALANATEYGLAGMVWTRDLSRAHTMVRAIRAGMLWVNCYHQWVPTLPHGALKLSGYGAKFGLQVVLDHTEERMVVIQL